MGLDRELFPSLSYYNTAAGQKLQPAIAILGMPADAGASSSRRPPPNKHFYRGSDGLATVPVFVAEVIVPVAAEVTPPVPAMRIVIRCVVGWCIHERITVDPREAADP